MNTLFNDTELFNEGKPSLVKYELPDAELVYIENFFDKQQSDSFYKILLKETNWKESEITIYGKVHQTPRLIAWYGDSKSTYSFSGTKLHPFNWTPELLSIKDKVEKQSGVIFNSVLLNLYRDGKDSVGWHRDNEKEFGENPVIASVSFGETRPFQLKHKFRKDLEKITIPLTHGSLLIMKGATQHFWEHQVPKTAKIISPRINLTYRHIIH